MASEPSLLLSFVKRLGAAPGAIKMGRQPAPTSYQSGRWDCNTLQTCWIKSCGIGHGATHGPGCNFERAWITTEKESQDRGSCKHAFTHKWRECRSLEPTTILTMSSLPLKMRAMASTKRPRAFFSPVFRVFVYLYEGTQACMPVSVPVLTASPS